ncbi:MAG TPA: RIP metalloprotease RseP [Alphaproteobacteria bacterium]|nr:RIP metalloprotease RseP [Alphaproteobacteria bacterium]
MEVFAGLWTYVLPFLIVLTVLVFVHELGHYWVARRNGVRIETFSIGFGPELFGWHDRAGTRWKLSAIPLGGYVKFFGDADAISMPGAELPAMTPEERAVSFHHKPLGQRAAIVAAGPIANFVFAIIVSAALFVLIGQPFTPPVVGGVMPGSAAEKAGFQAGDRIIRINGEQIGRFEDIQRIVQLDLDQPLKVVVQRGGEEVGLTASPSIIEETDRLGNKVRMARLGIRGGGMEYIRRGPGEALWQAVVETYDQTTGTLKALGQIVTGHRSSDELGGPLRIAQMSGEVAKGGVANLFAFMAFLSINLGLINLFPVPVLDGGHLLFYAFEAVRGRPLGPRAQEYGFRIGMVLVFSLMILATWNDLVHIGFVQRLVGWVS